MSGITARGTFNSHDLKDMPVINPGDWFGKTWLIEIGGSYWPLFLIVEADTITDAIYELAENEKYGHKIVVEDADLGDYPEAPHVAITLSAATCSPITASAWAFAPFC